MEGNRKLLRQSTYHVTALHHQLSPLLLHSYSPLPLCHHFSHPFKSTPPLQIQSYRISINNPYINHIHNVQVFISDPHGVFELVLFLLIYEAVKGTSSSSNTRAAASSLSNGSNVGICYVSCTCEEDVWQVS